LHGLRCSLGSADVRQLAGIGPPRETYTLVHRRGGGPSRLPDEFRASSVLLV